MPRAECNWDTAQALKAVDKGEMRFGHYVEFRAWGTRQGAVVTLCSDVKVVNKD